MVSQIYPSELQLNKANASGTEATFLDLHLSISNDIVSPKFVQIMPLRAKTSLASEPGISGHMFHCLI